MRIHPPLRRLALAAVLLAAAACRKVDEGDAAAAGGDSTTVVDSVAALLPPSEVAWAPVGGWSGTGDKSTPRFQVRGDEWRLVGHVRRLKKAETPWIIVKVFDASRTQVATFSIEDAAIDTSYVHTDPGVYHLTVSTHEARWDLSAEERRPVVERPEP